MTRFVGVAALAAGLLVLGYGAPAAQAECTAKIEKGKKYHWVAFKGGQLTTTGWFKFTSFQGKSQSQLQVIQHRDTDKKKVKFWGTHTASSFKIRDFKSGQRWHAYTKYCKGDVINGAVYTGGWKLLYNFQLHTNKIRK